MTKHDWQVGERCWVRDRGPRRGEILRIGPGKVAQIRTDRSLWTYDIREVFTNRDDVRVFMVKEDIDDLRGDERYAKRCVRAAERTLRDEQRVLGSVVARIETAKKRLAALRAKGGAK